MRPENEIPGQEYIAQFLKHMMSEEMGDVWMEYAALMHKVAPTATISWAL